MIASVLAISVKTEDAFAKDVLRRIDVVGAQDLFAHWSSIFKKAVHERAMDISVEKEAD